MTKKTMGLWAGVVLALAVSVHYELKIRDKMRLKFDKPGLLDLIGRKNHESNR